SVVANGENVCARALGVGELLPCGRVPRGDLAFLNGTARRAAVAQNDEIRIARAGGRGLLQSSLQGLLQISSATETAAANDVDGVLNARGVGRANRHDLCFRIEQR